MSMIGYLTQLTPAQLASIRKAPKTLTTEIEGSPTLCLGKMWNGLQFLLESYYPPRSDDGDGDEEGEAGDEDDGASGSRGADGERNGSSADGEGNIGSNIGSADENGAPDAAPFPEMLDQAVIGGDLLGPDLGYGPACVLDPEEVQQLAAELASVDGPTLRKAFDPAEMRTSDIYPSGIWSEGESVLHELMLSFVDLVAFYQQAAAAGNGVATYLS